MPKSTTSTAAAPAIKAVSKLAPAGTLKMAPKRAKSLLEELASLNDPTPTHADPEDTLWDAATTKGLGGDFRDSDADDSDTRTTQRSRLRVLEEEPRYAGRKVSRAQLQQPGSTSFESVNAAVSDSEPDNSPDDDDDVGDSVGGEDDDDDSNGDDDGDGDGEFSSRAPERGDSDSDNSDDISESELHQGSGKADEMNRLCSEYAELETEEQQVLQNAAVDPAGDAVKGQHTRNQLMVWESFMESRIRIQKPLALSNQLPQGDALTANFAPHLAADVAAAQQHMAALLQHLLAVQRHFLTQGTYFPADTASSRKRKRPTLSDLGAEVAEADCALAAFGEETFEKWRKKTQLAASRLHGKKFKALDQSIHEQMQQMMGNKAELVKRTQLKRTPIAIIGQESLSGQDPGVTNNHQPKEYDPEIFDDGDFYEALLRDLIERKSSTTTLDDPVAMGRHWLELNKLRPRMKRVVDTRASKGRKLRYDVQPKLVNFMAPNPQVFAYSEEAKDDLFRSLFIMPANS